MVLMVKERQKSIEPPGKGEVLEEFTGKGKREKEAYYKSQRNRNKQGTKKEMRPGKKKVKVEGRNELNA